VEVRRTDTGMDAIGRRTDRGMCVL
jgi:hypothetical protein